MWRIVLCLVGAPILGLWAGAAANPPGNGPGVGGALLGVGLPALVSVTAVSEADRGSPP
jgi:hypothetical protein